MGRSKWKLNYLEKKIVNKNLKKNWCRNSVIPFSCVNKTFSLYNGKEFKNIVISREKVGFKFGEFIVTRKFTNKVNLNKLKDKKKKIKK